MSDFWEQVYDTFVASIRSVGTACTLAAMGAYMHQRGFISAPGKRMLALMSQQVTFPLFLFTKIIYCNQDWSSESCPSVTESLKQVWMLLLWPLFVVTMGFVVGRVVSYVCRTPKNQQRSVMAAVAFGNSTGLPITLLTVVHTNFSKTSELGKVDPTLFLSVYLLLYPVLQWGLGGWLLAPSKEEQKANKLKQHDGEQHKDDIEQQQSQQKDKLENEDSSTLNTKTSDSPPLSSIMTEPPMLEEPFALGASAHTHLSSQPQQLHSVGSYIKVNVLNNKTVDQQYLRHRHGLYSSDEGLYLSEVNLSSLVQEDLSQQYPQPVTYVPTAAGGAYLAPMQSSGAMSYQQTALLPFRTPANTATTTAIPQGPTAAGLPTVVDDSHHFDDEEAGPQEEEEEPLRPIPRSTSTADSTDTNSPEFLLYDSTSGSSQGSTAGDDEDDAPASTEKQGEKRPLLADDTAVNNNKESSYGAAPLSNGDKDPSAAAAVVTTSTERTNDNNNHDNNSDKDEFKGDSIWVTLKNIAERCLQPPVVGAIAGILVAISPARGLFVDLVDRNADAPLEWLFDGLYSVGLTAVPINMIILGCNLSNSYNKFVASHQKQSNNEQGASSALVKKGEHDDAGQLNMTTMVGIVIGKMLVMPCIGFLSACVLETWFWDIPSDISAAFYLVLLIVFLTPTANNVMVMVELSGSNTKEGIANVIAMQYAVAPVILSCTMTMAIGYALSLP